MSNSKKNGRGVQRVWRGLTTITAVLLAFTLTIHVLVNGFRTDIDKFLGTQSSMVVTDTNGNNEDLYTFKSDYSSTKELLKAIEDLGEQMSEEGTVLLKNNGALPLTADETQKVSLLGFSSYYPVQGGDGKGMGGSFFANSGTDADTVNFVQALTAKGFKLNPDLQPIYQALEDQLISSKSPNVVAPQVGKTFSSLEPSQATLSSVNANWKNGLANYNVMIITIARSGGENTSYTPGIDGVDPEQNLNQTDPLGLSDDERDLIQAAVDAKGSNGKVIVLLNNTSTMEVQELEDNDGVDAILQIGMPGGYGFYGVADILSGAANPSGHLTDTYAVTNINAPSAQNYGRFLWTNANASYSINSAIVEAEGIYIGYKYYETRYIDTVLGQGNASSDVGTSGGPWSYDNEVTYPFGFGLSYTTFTQTLDSVEVNLAEKTVTATVTVTNIGTVAGKDVVQLYVSLPYIQGGLEKAGVQLLDYGKTSELAPNDSEVVTIVADIQNMTSWDSESDNAAGTKGNYVLDPGTYYFAVGNGAHEAANNVLAAQGKTTADGMTEDGDSSKVQTWELTARDDATFSITKNGVAVENQLADMDINYWLPGTATYLSRSDWQATWPKTYSDLTATDEMLAYMDNDIYVIGSGSGDPVTFGASNGLTLADLRGVTDLNDERWSLLMDQITLEECMLRTAFGGTSTKPIESIMSPEAIQNDGPNGIYSYTLGQYANTDASSGDPRVVDANDPNLSYQFGTMTNATVIAQTFNKTLAEEFGKVCGNYSLWANLTIHWGCGTNLHRSPYNGRNHEYYSEDPILTAGQGNAFIQGGLQYGCLIAAKHLAFNDTEINRIGISIFMTEQQARENELRCFQSIAENGALALMSSFNRVGIMASNAHTGLMMNILRKEWGYKGLISEDLIVDANYNALKEAVLNGVTMTCNTGNDAMDALSKRWDFWTVENVSKDNQLMAALKQAMIWQNYALANSNAMDGVSADSYVVTLRTWYDNLLTGLQIGFGALTVACAAMYILSVRRKEH